MTKVKQKTDQLQIGDNLWQVHGEVEHSVIIKNQKDEYIKLSMWDFLRIKTLAE